VFRRDETETYPTIRSWDWRNLVMIYRIFCTLFHIMDSSHTALRTTPRPLALFRCGQECFPWGKGLARNARRKAEVRFRLLTSSQVTAFRTNSRIGNRAFKTNGESLLICLPYHRESWLSGSKVEQKKSDEWTIMTG
jgi:hypothetical protein